MGSTRSRKELPQRELHVLRSSAWWWRAGGEDWDKRWNGDAGRSVDFFPSHRQSSSSLARSPLHVQCPACSVCGVMSFQESEAPFKDSGCLEEDSGGTVKTRLSHTRDNGKATALSRQGAVPSVVAHAFSPSRRERGRRISLSSRLAGATFETLSQKESRQVFMEPWAVNSLLDSGTLVYPVGVTFQTVLLWMTVIMCSLIVMFLLVPLSKDSWNCNTQETCFICQCKEN